MASGVHCALLFKVNDTKLYSRDECVNFAIQKGLDASRSKIKFFRHNDVEHLKQLLEQQAQEDKKVRDTFLMRSFL